MAVHHFRSNDRVNHKKGGYGATNVLTCTRCAKSDNNDFSTMTSRQGTGHRVRFMSIRPLSSTTTILQVRQETFRHILQQWRTRVRLPLYLASKTMITCPLPRTHDLVPTRRTLCLPLTMVAPSRIHRNAFEILKCTLFNLQNPSLLSDM